MSMYSLNPEHDFFLVRRAGPQEQAVLQDAHLFEYEELVRRLAAAQAVDRYASVLSTCH